MNRRDCLKSSVVLLAGAVASGCDGQGAGNGGSADVSSASGLSDREAMYDHGAPPIGTSGWTMPTGVLPGYPVLAQELDADVVVVGAGLAGSSLALHLAEAGISVAVLEARQPGWGASGRNAGHVLPTLKDVALFERFPDGGKAFLHLFREHHTITFDLARKHGIACDAVQSGYLHATSRASVFDKLKVKSVYWKEQQGQQVEWLEGADVEALTGSSYFSRGVLYRSGGRVNPYLLTNGMISAAVARGAGVFGGTEALSLARSGARWRVVTAQGAVVADRVVFCTNAYPTAIVPQFTNNFYPLTAYALSTKPLPRTALDIIMPSRATLSEEPVDLNPFVIDEHGRIITSSIPSVSRPDDAEWHFAKHLRWIHRTWPQTRDIKIELEHYWTGRVALRDIEFPGVFELERGVFGLMHFNAWGNLMAPLLGMALAGAMARDRMDQLPFPLETPVPVANPGKQELIIRKLMIPAARLGQRLGMI
ncbi:MAG: tRNA 5-methylaminomethyl-2-thiouridine biosynthesis bifunctional protein MnmC [Pseudomonadales bacterium]|nr:tRNA 5-methylaminomethyl-2-thiouridine biosynthesis bifunctional protein MnmC [Pseudomonadales bacterium]